LKKDYQILTVFGKNIPDTTNVICLFQRLTGLSTAELDQVSQAIIVSRLRYALPVWSGFLTAGLMSLFFFSFFSVLFSLVYRPCLNSFSNLVTVHI